MSRYIHKLIQEGEHLMQDFKFAVNDSRKIARSMVAFANTQGGRLLIGVKDNGTIAGVRSEEEYYMIEAAAQMYSRPQIDFQAINWLIDGKTILEIIIPRSDLLPHYSQDYDKKWIAYIRHNDQNLPAHVVQLMAWQKLHRKQGIHITYYDTQAILIDYLERNPYISISKFCKIALISRSKAEHILSDLMVLNIIECVVSEQQTVFKIK